MIFLKIIWTFLQTYVWPASGKPSFKKYKNIQGWLTPFEAFGLRLVATQLNENANILEIGSWKGKSTYCIAHGLRSGVITCIDPFNADGEIQSKSTYDTERGEEDLLLQFKKNLVLFDQKVKITPFKGYSSEFVGKVTDVDFLFIDGDHSKEGCLFDFENFEKLIKPGGYLAFHDYNPKRKELGPTFVVEQVVSKRKNYKMIRSFDSLVVFKKD